MKEHRPVTKKQSATASQNDTLRERKQYLLNLIGFIRSKKMTLNTVETLSVKALNAEVQRVEGRLNKLP